MSAASHDPQRSNRSRSSSRTRSRAALFTSGAAVTALALSACTSGGTSGGSGNTGFVTGTDGTVRRWDVHTLKQLNAFEGHE